MRLQSTGVAFIHALCAGRHREADRLALELVAKTAKGDEWPTPITLTTEEIKALARNRVMELP